MRMLFVQEFTYQDPLGVLYLAAALRADGHEVGFVDVALDKQWLRRALDFQPHAVGYSVITGNQAGLLQANAELKRRSSFLSVWGGPHPTFFPEILDEEGVDVVCVGEGEGAIVDLARAVDGGENLSEIANLHVKTASGVVRNPPRHLCQNLDGLPLPERSLLHRYPKYRYVTARSVMASRGCPHGCTFCFNARLRRMYKGKGTYVRRRSARAVVDECRSHLDDPWATQILFKDDLFAHDEAFVSEFSEDYRRRVGLPFMCNVRADRLTERMADDLARAGARVVQFGVESGSERVRREILGRPISDEAIRRAARLILDRGMRLYTSNIVGIPGETPKEALATLELNGSIGATAAMFTMFQPYPRTPLGDRAAELGWCDAERVDLQPSYYRCSTPGHEDWRLYQRMAYLFPAAAKLPALRRLAPLLVRLPLGSLYSGVDFVYKSTSFVLDLGITPPRDVALYSGMWTPRRPPRRRTA